MAEILRVRNSTQRLGFKWFATRNGVKQVFDLTGCTLQLLLHTSPVEATPLTPSAISIAGTITNGSSGEAYFPLTTAITGQVRVLHFQVWIVDANAETYPIDKGTLRIEPGLKG